MKYLLYIVLLLPVAAFADQSVIEQTPRVTSQLREIDYTVGDIARQTITITTPLGYRLDTSTLPRLGTHKVIEIRQVASSFKDEQALTRHTVTIDWQVFMALSVIRAVPLLDLDLQFLREGKVLPVHIPAGEVIISPLLPTRIDKAHLQPKPDVQALPVALSPYLYTLVPGLMGLLLSTLYFAWHAGWIRSRVDASLPFRQAWQSIVKLRKQANAMHANTSSISNMGRDQSIRQAMALLSRAFDQFAGHAVSAENLAQLFSTYPSLHKQQAAIVRFYQDAQHVFFGGRRPTHGLHEVEKLTRQLSRQLVA